MAADLTTMTHSELTSRLAELNGMVADRRREIASARTAAKRERIEASIRHLGWLIDDVNAALAALPVVAAPAPVTARPVRAELTAADLAEIAGRPAPASVVARYVPTANRGPFAEYAASHPLPGEDE